MLSHFASRQETCLLIAESLSDSVTAPSAEKIRALFGRADAALREALWLLDAQLAEERHMQKTARHTALYKERAEVLVVHGRVLLSTSRIFPDVSALQRADSLLSSIHDSVMTAGALQVQAEVCEAIADFQSLPDATLTRARAISLCQVALQKQFESADESVRVHDLYSLIGDVALSKAQTTCDRDDAAVAIQIGAEAYQKAIDCCMNAQNSVLDREVPYNLACLLSIGLRYSVVPESSERRIQDLLQSCRSNGTALIGDLRTDDDLSAVRERIWFSDLLREPRRAVECTL